MNIAKFYRIKDEAERDCAAARQLGERMREARERYQRAEGALTRAEEVARQHVEALSPQFAKEVGTTKSEFDRLHTSYLEALALSQASLQSVDNLTKFLKDQGITP